MQTFKQKSSLTRNLKKNGIDVSTGEILQNDAGGWFFQNAAAKAAHEARLAKTTKNVKSADTEKAPILRKSEIESPCAVVWTLADTMTDARRKDVIAAAVAKGVAFYTARTQYQLWRQASKASAK